MRGGGGSFEGFVAELQMLILVITASILDWRVLARGDGCEGNTPAD